MFAIGENETVMSYACAMGTLSHPRLLSAIAGFFPSSAPKGKLSADY